MGQVGARLDERGRRLFAAAEVRAVGRGGLATVSQAPVADLRHDVTGFQPGAGS